MTPAGPELNLGLLPMLLIGGGFLAAWIGVDLWRLDRRVRARQREHVNAAADEVNGHPTSVNTKHRS